MSWMRRVLELLGRSDPSPVVPANPEQAQTLQRADAMLENPKIKAILSERDRQLRASFQRANARIGGR